MCLCFFCVEMWRVPLHFCVAFVFVAFLVFSVLLVLRSSLCSIPIAVFAVLACCATWALVWWLWFMDKPKLHLSEPSETCLFKHCPLKRWHEARAALKAKLFDACLSSELPSEYKFLRLRWTACIEAWKWLSRSWEWFGLICKAKQREKRSNHILLHNHCLCRFLFGRTPHAKVLAGMASFCQPCVLREPAQEGASRQPSEGQHCWEHRVSENIHGRDSERRRSNRYRQHREPRTHGRALQCVRANIETCNADVDHDSCVQRPLQLQPAPESWQHGDWDHLASGVMQGHNSTFSPCQAQKPQNPRKQTRKQQETRSHESSLKAVTSHHSASKQAINEASEQESRKQPGQQATRQQANKNAIQEMLSKSLVWSSFFWI